MGCATSQQAEGKGTNEELFTRRSSVGPLLSDEGDADRRADEPGEFDDDDEYEDEPVLGADQASLDHYRRATFDQDEKDPYFTEHVTVVHRRPSSLAANEAAVVGGGGGGDAAPFRRAASIIKKQSSYSEQPPVDETSRSTAPGDDGAGEERATVAFAGIPRTSSFDMGDGAAAHSPQTGQLRRTASGRRVGFA
jgi:hypothetical protein